MECKHLNYTKMQSCGGIYRDLEVTLNTYLMSVQLRSSSQESISSAWSRRKVDKVEHFVMSASYLYNQYNSQFVGSWGTL